MDKNSVFMTAFWAGLASPSAVHAATPVYRPQICDLTFFAPFAVVGELITLSLPGHNDGRHQPDEQPFPVSANPGDGQLSLDI